MLIIVKNRKELNFATTLYKASIEHDLSFDIKVKKAEHYYEHKPVHAQFPVSSSQTVQFT